MTRQPSDNAQAVQHLRRDLRQENWKMSRDEALGDFSIQIVDINVEESFK
jgi:hypothetical protein